MPFRTLSFQGELHVQAAQHSRRFCPGNASRVRSRADSYRNQISERKWPIDHLERSVPLLASVVLATMFVEHLVPEFSVRFLPALIVNERLCRSASLSGHRQIQIVQGGEVW